jgi:hypothetical protein
MELAGYAWDNLPEGSLVVDVGGGVGWQALILATHFPQLRFVIQDREPVVRDAVEVRGLDPRSSSMVCPEYGLYGPQFWKKNMPDALESGRVKLLCLLISAYTTSVTHSDISLCRPQLLWATACAAR